MKVNGDQNRLVSNILQNISFCASQEKKSYRFRTSWGRVNHDRTVIFGSPFNSVTARPDHDRVQNKSTDNNTITRLSSESKFIGHMPYCHWRALFDWGHWNSDIYFWNLYILTYPLNMNWKNLCSQSNFISISIICMFIWPITNIQNQY